MTVTTNGIGAGRGIRPRAGARRPLVLSLLDGFELRAADERLTLPLAGQRVVAFLALQRRPVQRAYVAGTLWLDVGDERAQASLRTTLWRAGVAREGLVRSTATHLSLGPDVRVDLHEATQCAQALLRDDGAEPAPDTLERLTEAGALLPDWYDDWLLIERETFRQVRLLALEALCERCARAGRHAEAARAGLAAVAAEPLRESAHRALVRAHLADGNPGEALRQYRLCEEILGRHLGLRPSAELRSLLRPMV